MGPASVHLYLLSSSCSQIHSPWIGDIADSGIGLSYRPSSLNSLASRYDSPMPESTLYLESGTMNLATGLHQAVASGSLCFWYAFRNVFAVSACFAAGGILFHFSGIPSLKKSSFIYSWDMDPQVQRIRRCPGHSFSITWNFKPRVTIHSMDQITIKTPNPKVVFSWNLPVKGFGGRCLSVWGPLPSYVFFL